ncbi:serine/threonine-protein phosphatase 6 regulatory ankyrin repeat subunit C-like [Styela clava]
MTEVHALFDTQHLVNSIQDANILEQAVFHGDADEVRSLIFKKEDVNAIDSERRSPLHAAAFLGDGEIVELLILSGAHINAKDSKWITPLHRACASRGGEAVKILLKHQADVNARDKSWQSPLHVAAAHDALACAELLVPHLSNLNLSDRAGRQALHHAALNGHISIVNLLLDNGANVHAYDRQERRAIHWAAYMGHTEIIKALVSHGAEINCRDKHNQNTPMHAAASAGQISVVKMFIDLGCDINTPNGHRDTPLHLACLNGQDVVVHELLKAGAKVNMANDNSCTPLHLAAKSTHGALSLELLVNSEANVNVQDENGKTPLHMTAVHGRFTRSQKLLQNGARVDLADKEGNTALHVASRYGHELLVTTLLESNANPRRHGTDGAIPLGLAAIHGNVNCCRKLLLSRSDDDPESNPEVHINIKDNNDRTCLHYAACGGSLECLDMFMSYVEPVDAFKRDKHGRTPLYYALGSARFDCAKRLITTMASISIDDGVSAFDINDADECGRTLLHHAVAADWNGRCVELLLSRNADCGLTDKHRHTPMHYAAICGHDTIVEMLYDQQPSVLEQAHKDMHVPSPLHYAAYNGHTDVVSYLADILIDLEICDEQGRTPLQIASFQGHADCIQSLLIQGASFMQVNENTKQTALHLAACNGHTKVMKLLLEDAAVDSGGMDDQEVKKYINAKDINGTTALMHCVTNGHVTSLEFLLSQGANPLLRDKYGCTAMHRAAAIGHEDVIISLLKHFNGGRSYDENTSGPASKATVMQSRTGKTPLHFASIRGSTDILETLLRYAASVNTVDKFGYTALHYACYEGHEGCVEALVMHESFSTMEGSAFSPLHCAVYNDNEICADRLLDVFDDEVTHIFDNLGRTPLHVAAMKDHIDCIQFLLSHSADVNAVDSMARTPLMLAAIEGNINAVELLLNMKSDVALVDKDNNNALHLACLNRKSDCAITIIEKAGEPAIVNAQNNDGQTPLHISGKAGLLPVTQQLLMHDAATEILDNRGMNAALSCAPTNDVADCLELIISFMTDNSNTTSHSSTAPRSSMESSQSRASYVGTIIEKISENHEPEVNGEVDNVDSDTYF